MSWTFHSGIPVEVPDDDDEPTPKLDRLASRPSPFEPEEVSE